MQRARFRFDRALNGGGMIVTDRRISEADVRAIQQFWDEGYSGPQIVERMNQR